MSEANKKMFVMLVDIEAVNCPMADRDQWKDKFDRLAEVVEGMKCERAILGTLSCWIANDIAKSRNEQSKLCRICVAKDELVKIREG
jgi:hypothetical protein